MELMEGLLSRRSVRQYTDQKVAAADITDIVKAGMYAPSARNQQVWEFVVITDKDKLAQFSSGLPSAPMAKTAAFAVAVCADRAARRRRNTGNRIARRQWKTCCWPVMRKGWAPSGSACTRTKNAKTLLKKYAPCPITSKFIL